MATPSASLQGWKAIGISIAVAAIAFWLSSPENPTLAGIGLLSLPLALWPSIMLLLTGERHHVPIGVLTAVAWLYFCAPFTYTIFPAWDFSRFYTASDLLLAVTFSGVSIAALLVGYYCNLIRRKPLFNSQQRFEKVTLRRLIYWLLFVGWMYFMALRIWPVQINEVGRVIAILESCTTFGYALALLAILRKTASPLLLGVVCVSLVGDLFVIVSTTLMAGAVFLAASLCLVFVLEKGKLPWKTMIISFFLILPPYSGRMFHRFDVDQSMGGAPFITLLQKGLSSLWQDYADFEWRSGFTVMDVQLSTRLETASFLAHCINQHASGKEFKYGETFWYLPLVLVPRFILPIKPSNTQGGSLSEEYGLKGLESYDTSINFPWLVEFYINFGAWGMVLCSICVGVFVRSVFDLAGMGLGDLNLLLFVQLLHWIFAVESNVTLIFGNMLQICFVWWVISRLILVKGAARQVS